MLPRQNNKLYSVGQQLQIAKNMKNFTKISFLALFLLFSLTSKAQILISLVFGDALNTPKIEFGLVGGLNRSYLTDISNSD
mgnify:CR=1 FL=1